MNFGPNPEPLAYFVAQIRQPKYRPYSKLYRAFDAGFRSRYARQGHECNPHAVDTSDNLETEWFAWNFGWHVANENDQEVKFTTAAHPRGIVEHVKDVCSKFPADPNEIVFISRFALAGVDEASAKDLCVWIDVDADHVNLVYAAFAESRRLKSQGKTKQYISQAIMDLMGKEDDSGIREMISMKDPSITDLGLTEEIMVNYLQGSLSIKENATRRGLPEEFVGSVYYFSDFVRNNIGMMKPQELMAWTLVEPVMHYEYSLTVDQVDLLIDKMLA